MIERIETQAISNGRLKSTGHPISSSERKKIKISIKLYCNELAVNGKNIYYIEADAHFPLGVLTIKDRIFLIVENHGWESESYSIIEVFSSGLNDLISTYGGGC